LNVLIIGGTGVLSRAVAKVFVQSNTDVWIVTDGKGILPKPEGIKGHILADRTNPEILKNKLTKESPNKWDLVVDVICFNSKNAAEILEISGKNSPHFIFVSTAIIYSLEQTEDIVEHSAILPTDKMNNYVRNKWEMECYLHNFSTQRNFPITIMRPCQILGEGCLLGLVPLHNRDISLINRIRSGKPVLLADEGKQRFQIVHTADVAKAIFKAACNNKAYGMTYNVANPIPITGRDHIVTLASIMKVEPNFLNIPAEVVQRSTWGWNFSLYSRILKMDKMENDLGYLPSISHQTSVIDAFHYLEKHPVENTFDNLYEVASAIKNHTPSLPTLLNRAATNRLKSQTDFRMNS
jgi:nucleoside-diphosphate-sugar epimerase